MKHSEMEGRGHGGAQGCGLRAGQWAGLSPAWAELPLTQLRGLDSPQQRPLELCGQSLGYVKGDQNQK